MKLYATILTLIAGMLISAHTQAGSDKKTIVFKVYGNCGMCKKNIETALELKGIKSANWNVDSKMLEVTFVPSQISEDQIHEAIAKAGYDTDKVKARDEDYQNLHTCCQYRK